MYAHTTQLALIQVLSLWRFLFLLLLRAPRLTLFPYTTLFRSSGAKSFRQSTRSFKSLTGSVCARLSPRGASWRKPRSEEHTSELQSHVNLVCRLLLEKKNLVLLYSTITIRFHAILVSLSVCCL